MQTSRKPVSDGVLKTYTVKTQTKCSEEGESMCWYEVHVYSRITVVADGTVMEINGMVPVEVAHTINRFAPVRPRLVF